MRDTAIIVSCPDGCYSCVSQYGFFDDKVGPVTLCVLIMLALTAILVMAVIDYVHG